MKDEEMTKEQLLSELAKLRQRILELENPNADCPFISTLCEPSSPNKSIAKPKSLTSFIHGCQQPVSKSNRYHISELIDITLLQQLFDSFFDLTGIMHALLDVDTNILTRTGWSDICLNFHRVCPQTEHRCKQSDAFISHHLQDGPYIKYRCLNGLTDYATPIIVEGQHLATIYMGQMFNEPPDEEYFRRQAQEFGFDETAYIEALHKVNIIPEEKIEPIMEFYSKLGQVLASMGLERLRRIEEADEVIREREERLRLALEGSADAPWDWNIETGYMHWDSRLIEILGYSNGEIEPHIHAWDRLIHPDDIYHTLKTLNEHLDGRIPNYRGEYRILTKSGEWKWILGRGRVVARNEQGKPLRAAGTFSDIDERKKTENALLESRAQIKAIIDNIPFYAYLLDNEGKFVAVNNTYCEECGLTEDEIVGKTAFDIYPYNEAETYWTEDTEVIRSKQQRTGETLLISKGKKEIWIEKYKKPIYDNKGSAIGVVGLLRDVTEKKTFEREVGRLDRLNLVGEMAASIGHEIRNPMTSVRGFLQLFKDKYYEDKESLNLMIEELDRANSILSEFLLLARNKAVELKPTNLNSIIRKLMPLVEANANIQEMSIKIETDDIPDLLLDEKEIRQLLLNLIRNGMESMSPGGEVTIKTFKEGETVVLSIKDQGHGIDSGIMNKLGIPFFSTKEQGTGLGLAVCYGIATRHKAKINIETGSTGTNVLLRFPVMQ